MVVRGCTALCVTGLLLGCVFGSHGLDLLRPAAASGNPPSRPVVQCRCIGFPNQTLCLWPQQRDQYGPTHYVATYSERNQKSITKECHLVRPGSSSLGLSSASSNSSQQLWHCHFEELKLLTDYIINVTAVNKLGSSTSLTSFMMEDIVKPNPPVDVRVSPNGFRKLSVEWSPPPTWSSLDIFPLKYKIRYQWQTRDSSKTVKLGPFESTKMDLRGLAPGRAYLVQVCAMEFLDLGECSDWSSPVRAFMAKR